MATTYTKSLSVDFGGNINPSILKDEINDDPGITPLLIRIIVDVGGDTVDIKFNAALSAGEQTTLDTLISSHDSGDLPVIKMSASGSTNTITTLLTNQTGNRNITLPDATTTLAGIDISQTITNKIVSDASNTVGANEIRTTGASVVVDTAAPPTTGQVLKATSATAATWQTPDTVITDHGGLTGLADDDHTQYTLLAGRAGGQDLIGGTAASNVLSLESTSNATKGTIDLKDPVRVDDLDTLTATTMLIGKSTATKVEIADTGVVTEIQGNLDALEGLDVTGNITVTGTVDGRDVATDGTTLDNHVAATAAHGATGAVVGTTNTQTLTNKTITATSNDVAANSLHSATTVVDVSAATAPTSGQILTATSGTTATWQTPSSVFGSEYHYQVSEGESTTTSTTLQTKVTITTSSLPSGTYRLGYTYELSNQSNGVLSEVEVALDGTVVNISTFEADNDYHALGGFVHQSLTGVITATIKYRVQTTGTAAIRRARLELWRVV